MQMKDFYHAHYSSNIMCLSVYGSQSLDDLEMLVKEKFAAVPNSKLPPANIPSKNLQAQYIVTKEFFDATSASLFWTTMIGKRKLHSIRPVASLVLQRKEQFQSRKLLLAPTASSNAVALWQPCQATVICLCMNVTVCCRLGIGICANRSTWLLQKLPQKLLLTSFSTPRRHLLLRQPATSPQH